MYEGQRKLQKFRTDSQCTFLARLGRWFIAIVVGCLLVLSCGELRYVVQYYEVDTTGRSPSDSCCVEVWRRYFPRKVTKFRLKYPKDKCLENSE